MALILTNVFILATPFKFLKMTIGLISKLDCTNAPRNVKSRVGAGQLSLHSHFTPEHLETGTLTSLLSSVRQSHVFPLPDGPT